MGADSSLGGKGDEVSRSWNPSTRQRDQPDSRYGPHGGIKSAVQGSVDVSTMKVVKIGIEWIALDARGRGGRGFSRLSRKEEFGGI